MQELMIDFAGIFVRRAWPPWGPDLQNDFQGVANRTLGATERSSLLDQRRPPGAFSSKPAAQRFPRDLCPFTMPERDHIDQRALGRGEAEI